MLHATTTACLAPATTTTNNNNMNVNSGKCDVTLTEVSDPSTPTNVMSSESRDDMQLLAVLEEANRFAHFSGLLFFIPSYTFINS